jgi:hypothetical protein
VADWEEKELWPAYMHLTDAGAAFRLQKTDLCLRAVWHQTAGRVQSHLLACFLAYVLRKTLEGWMARAGLGHGPTMVLEDVARIQSTDVVAPTTDGRMLRLRCVVRPDNAPALLLHRPGLKLPQRPRLPAGMGGM